MSASPSLFEIKGKARTLQQQLSCKLHVAQQMVANSHGFRNWQTLSAMLSSNQFEKNKAESDSFGIPKAVLEFIEGLENDASQVEKSDFAKSVYFSLDVKDAMDFDVRDDFEEASPNLFSRSLLLRDWNLYISGDPDFHGLEESRAGVKALQTEELMRSFDPDDFCDSFMQDQMDNYTILRYKNTKPEMTFEQAYALAMERCFFHPFFMWMNGTFIDLGSLPEIKVDGRVVCQKIKVDGRVVCQNFYGH